MEIQQIDIPVAAGTSMEAWLVEEHALPIVFVEIFWRAGSVAESADRAGLVYMLSGMLDEGAGSLDSEAFQKRLADLNIEMEFHASRETFHASVKTLEENLDAAFELLTLALHEPRFDAPALERVRAQILAGLRDDSKNPDVMASRAWFAAAFPGHPYGRPRQGSEASVAALTGDDLRGWMRRALARDNIGIAVVGAVAPQRARELLAGALGGLPAASEVTATEETGFAAAGRQEVIAHPNPQTVIRFGHGGIKRKDEDFIAAYVMNHILGGSALVSRLGDEVREKRGLAYSVYSWLYPLDHAGLFLGAVATENSRAGEALAQIKEEMRRLREEGVSAEELESAKTYLTGSYPLRFDSSEGIAGQLSGLQRQELDAGYIARRNDLIREVTREDIQRVARRILDPDELLVVMVGEPELGEEASQ